MKTIKVQAQTDANGILRLELPIHMPNAALEVLIVIQPADAALSAQNQEAADVTEPIDLNRVNSVTQQIADDPIGHLSDKPFSRAAWGQYED